MSEIIIVTVVLQAVTLVVTAASPVLVGIGFLLRHIKKSSCCGGSIEVAEHNKSEDSPLTKKTEAGGMLPQ
jgi:hypothetical protein